MGLESANYLLIPRDGLKSVPEVLRGLGAILREPFPSSDFERWVLRDEGYWFDVMTGEIASDGMPAVSLRVALSNPEQAAQAFRTVLETLVREAPGRLLDRQSHRSYTELGEQEWQEVLQAWTSKRDEFQRNFGPFEAPISGEEVFDALHARKQHSRKP